YATAAVLAAPDRDVTGQEFAHLLGLSYQQVVRLTDGDWLRQQGRERRAARKAAAGTFGDEVSSALLGFSLWLPDGWSVCGKIDDIEDSHDMGEVGREV